MKHSFSPAAVPSILLYGCTTWMLTKWLEKKLDANYTRMLRAILNKSWRQHPTKKQLYGHLPPIKKTIKIRWTRHVGHYWKSRYELISNVLQWTPSHDRAKAGQPARTYVQELCADTGCSPEDLLEAMDDREGWWERIRDICTDSTTWWWWWPVPQKSHSRILPATNTYIYIYILYIYIQIDSILMGLTPGSTISEIYVFQIENKIFKTTITKPEIYIRYEDNIFIATHSYDEINKEFHPFSKVIISKVNVIAWLEFELAYFKAIVQHFSHYAMGTPLFVSSSEKQRRVEFLCSSGENILQISSSVPRP